MFSPSGSPKATYGAGIHLYPKGQSVLPEKINKPRWTSVEPFGPEAHCRRAQSKPLPSGYTLPNNLDIDARFGIR